MEALEAERLATRRLALRRMGVPDVSRVFTSQVQATGLEAELLSLPLYDADAQAMQNPTTGAAYFMVGISAVSASDEVGEA